MVNFSNGETILLIWFYYKNHSSTVVAVVKPLLTLHSCFIHKCVIFILFYLIPV